MKLYIRANSENTSDSIYTIGRYGMYSDGSFRLEETFTTDSPYWKVVDGKIYYISWSVVRGQYREDKLIEVMMNEDDAIKNNCGCYYEILKVE